MGILARNVGPEEGYNEFGRTYVKNDSGVSISKGDLVYISGASHVSDTALPEVTLADADASGGALGRLKIAAMDIADKAVGVVVDYLMFIPATNPSGVAGTDLWLSTTPGAYSESKPSTGKARKVGEVVIKGSSASATLLFLNTLGWPDIEDDSAGALGVGESRVITFGTVAFDDSPADTDVLTIPAGEVWVAEYSVVDVGVAWDGTGAALDFGIKTTNPDAIIDSTSSPDVDITSATEQLVNRQALLDATGGALTLTIDTTPGTTATTGTATIRTKFTRIA